MVLLVVGNYQAVDVERIPWTTISGVTWVHCRRDGTVDLKRLLKLKCREHGIPLDIQFAVPPSEPTELVPNELLIGFGLRLSQEVILYDELLNTLRSATTNQITETCANVP